jgi:transcriptional regulator with XRE-family HTH domain
VAENLGNKLKSLRKGRKFTQQELSERMGVSRTTIANYESQRRSPSLHELRRYAEIFNVSLDFFGVEATDESFELLSRARAIFTNEELPKEKKREIYEELMRLYLGV